MPTAFTGRGWIEKADFKGFMYESDDEKSPNDVVISRTHRTWNKETAIQILKENPDEYYENKDFFSYLPGIAPLSVDS